MKKNLMIFISSILSGMCIALGATVYLLCNNGEFLCKFIGALMFCIGLYTIIHFDLWLYTGKVGYVLDNKPNYLINVVVCFIGNLIGALFLSFIISITTLGPTLQERAKLIAEPKMETSWYSILILSMMCGIMIYLAVEGHKKAKYTLAKTVFAFFPIILFILAGFEHVVANVAYFTYAHVFSFKVVLYFLLMFIGNGLGSVMFDTLLKLVNKLKEEKVLDNKEKNNIDEI